MSATRGQLDYEAIAEELSDPGTTLDDIQRAAVKRAGAYAKKARLPWPPEPTNSGWQVTVWSIR